MNYGLAETRSYNVLNQLTNINVGSFENLTYNYPAGSNNGKISSMSNAISGETVTYTYDSLNRLLTANGSGWGQQYGFDSFGNLLSKTVTAGSGPSLSQAVNPANNQIVGYSYDANGNTGAVSNGGSTYDLLYDPENRLSGVYPGGQGLPTASDGYDAQNRRIYSGPPSTDSYGNATDYTVSVYTPGGQRLGGYLIAAIVSELSGEWTTSMQVTNTSSDQYFGSRRVAVLDQLGSAGNSTFSQGTYYPWGEVKGGTNPQNAWSFATYWQDSSSGLDYAKNRYYSNMLGRFITPDPSRSSGGPSNPQSWNRYSYASGDPVNRLDPAGLMDTAVCDFDGNEADCFGSGGGDDGGEFCDASQQSCDTCFAADGIGFLPGPGCPGNGGPPTITTSSAPPPPCQDDWGNVDQTLESLGTNILSIAEQKIPGLTSQETSALGGTIQSDITSEMNTIMAAGTGNTSPPFFEGGHYNLDITTQQINNDLGPLGQTFIKDFTVGLFGTLDGVRQSAPNQPGYTLHSKAAGNQVDFHFDRFGYRNLPGHWGYDVGYGSLSHACLDPVWQH